MGCELGAGAAASGFAARGGEGSLLRSEDEPMKIKPTSKKGRVVVELDRKDEPLLEQPKGFQLNRILVPVDFSETSKKALEYAVAFAMQFRAKLILLHVIQPVAFPAELGYVPTELADFGETATKAALQKLQALCREHPQQLGGEQAVERVVRQGTPWHEIATAAKESAADLIIIATHGHTGLKHVLLGSTTERVVRHAPCPVLVVREREHDFVPPSTKQSSVS